jgi:hypothetical protein
MQTSAVLAATLLGTVLVAQSKPDYNGTWVSDEVKNAKPINEGLTAGHVRFTVAVTDKDANMVADVPDPQQARSVCSFGTTPFENPRRMRPVMCLAKWEGDSLVVSFTTKAMGTYPGSHSTDTYSFDGIELKIVTVAVRPDGTPDFSFTTFYTRAK